MTRNLEYKSLNIEIKSFDKLKGIFKGYAASFNQIDKVNDTILPEAFDKSIEAFNSGSLKISTNYDHWSAIELSDNLLSITKDDYGLLVEIQVSEEAKKVYEELYTKFVALVEIGKLFMSIGGYVEKSSLGEERWIKKDVANALDEIQEFELEHIAFTEFPIDSNAKMLEVKSKRKAQVKSVDLSDVDGEVSAIKFLANNKDHMSKAEAKSFVFHLKNLWKVEKSNKKENLGNDSQGTQTTSRQGSDSFDVNNIAKYLN